jgi:hypothetical protein
MGEKKRRIIHAPSGTVLAPSGGGAGASWSVAALPTAESWATWLGSCLASLLKTLFLPVGWPGSVTTDYAQYQVMDTLQALCSYLRGILTTRAVLSGLGVGDSTKSVLSSTVIWVLKDGASLLTGLVYSSLHASSADADPKFYRLVADVSNDIALTVELFAPIACMWWDVDGDGGRSRDGAFFLMICLANSLKAICGVSAGCVRVILTQHFAKTHNAADVNAKESTQETFVTLLGIIAGSYLLAPLDSDPTLLWAVFGVLTLLHVWANWWAMAALRLPLLNANTAAVSLLDAAGSELSVPERVARWNALDPILPQHMWAWSRIRPLDVVACEIWRWASVVWVSARAVWSLWICPPIIVVWGLMGGLLDGLPLWGAFQRSLCEPFRLASAVPTETLLLSSPPPSLRDLARNVSISIGELSACELDEAAAAIVAVNWRVIATGDVESLWFTPALSVVLHARAAPRDVVAGYVECVLWRLWTFGDVSHPVVARLLATVTKPRPSTPAERWRSINSPLREEFHEAAGTLSDELLERWGDAVIALPDRGWRVDDRDDD